MNVQERRRTVDSAHKAQREPAAEGALGAQQRIDELEAALSNERLELEVRNEELLRAQLEAERAQRVFGELFHAAPAAYLTLDDKGAVTRANAAACELLEVRHECLIGLRFGAFVEESSWDVLGERLGALQDAQRSVCELWLKRWSGTRCYVRMDAARGANLASEYLILFTDLSDRRREQSALESSKRQLEAQLQALEPLLDRGVVAANIAHDFNNLLAGVILNADMALLSQDLPEALRQPLALIARTASDAAALSRQLLTSANEVDPAAQVVDLPSVIGDALELLRARAGKGVELQTQLPAELPAIAADRLQVQRVMMNLLTNAIEAVADTGIITVGAHAETLDADALASFQHGRTARPGAFAIVHIADTGPGMDAAELSRVFDRRVTTKAAGRGLGLAIVLDIVGLCGGALHVISQPGQGTSFEIAFPVGTVARACEPVRVPEPQPAESASVLLIDDDQLLSTAIARALHTTGYQVAVANDGKSGLAQFMAAERPFDVVVLDWLMPGISGQDVLAELRRLQPDLPIVLLSGFGMERTPSDDELVIRSMKPASLSELRSAIANALAAGKRRSRLRPSSAPRTHAG